MNRDEKFKKKWEGIRKKGFARYVLKSTLYCTLGIFVGIILVRLFSNKTGSSSNDPVSIFIAVFLGSSLGWKINERRYKKLQRPLKEDE